MAIDLLLIPIMLVDPKRLQSSAKITVNDRRNRLSIKTIQAIKCLKSWLDLRVIFDDIKDEDSLRDIKATIKVSSSSDTSSSRGIESSRGKNT